jgi:cell division septation protein DedD
MEKVLIKDGFKPFVTYENKLYKLQVGAFSEKSNAEEMVKKLQSLGYRPFIKYE